MKLSEAAATYERLAPELEAIKPKLRELEQAEKVLKEHFKSTGRRSYAGRIGCRFGTRRFFDQAKAKELLGSRADDAMQEGTTAQLFLLKGTVPDVAGQDL